jgi:hypothetical protein
VSWAQCRVLESSGIEGSIPLSVVSRDASHNPGSAGVRAEGPTCPVVAARLSPCPPLSRG